MLAPALSAEMAEHAQRLSEFRRRLPRVLVGALGFFGPWQAAIPEDCGSTTLTDYALGALLDKLDVKFPPDT